MNTSPVSGLHHVTAIATDPQANIDFYAGLLGLRLVKKTVNFDDPSAYHLYYGDGQGSPGSIITFFYWPGAARGREGTGQPTAIALSAPVNSLEYWQDRLTRAGVAVQRRERLGDSLLAFADPDGIRVEIVAVGGDRRPAWTGGEVPETAALRGMHTLELSVRDAGPTETLLTEQMGFREVRRESGRARFEAGPGGSGRYVDVVTGAQLPRGFGGAGTIHHVAFRVATDADELEMQQRLADAGYHVSDVRDRSYFHSIYYREHGGILFEIATDVPGFAIDEQAETLGTELKLPPQFEPARARIEGVLPALAAPRVFA